ncbi:MAG: exopolyphosphatase [Granulosicoccaceae bacterium]|jgi:exopolyphosphatase/guanosine-5'-triphosphate,3'-diphosphate pyrophosphatase
MSRNTRTVAAVDLGSNSFHLVVARIVDGHLEIIDRIKEMVRLASGLDEHKNLSADAIERALACLERFGQRLRDHETGSVIAVGTNTLRSARGTENFLEQAEEKLGHPIDIISGIEEARLVYQGVSHSLEHDAETRLVIDIGGGSTECIIGRQQLPECMESLYMGCVSYSKRFFPEGQITAKRFKRAVLAARVELEPYESRFGKPHWEEAVGASGTIRTVAEVLLQQNWSERGISLNGLNTLAEHIIKAGHYKEFALAGLSKERAPVFAGGIAILKALFEALGIERMRVASGALREGALIDLLGRLRHDDIRERTVRRFIERFAIDAQQAQRVRDTACYLFDLVEDDWKLKPTEKDMLCWAAQFHELGLTIAHSQYHKHGAYILRNADLPGFSRHEQEFLASLVRAHRRKFPVTEMETVSRPWKRRSVHLAVLLRLAVLLQRSRSDVQLSVIRIDAGKKSLRLDLPAEWLAEHPLTQCDLEEESGFLAAAGFELELPVS